MIKIAPENSLIHKPICIWFTGLSGSGKSTLAYATQQALVSQGKQVYVLDGDELRKGLNSV
jgi:adenylylsulfate kinase